MSPSPPVSPAVTSAKPSNKFRFGKLKKNPRNGTATLQLKVPGPGSLELSGAAVRSVKRAAPQRPARWP